MAIGLPIVSKFDDKGVKDAESALGKVGKTLGGIAGAAALAAGAAGVGLLTKALSSGFDRLTAIDNAESKLRGLGHSAANVEAIMENALAAVKGTAFGLDEAATVAASAVAAGIQPGQELTKYLTLAADAASIAGVSMDEMGSIMNKVTTSGKAQNDVLRQLADRELPIYQLLAEQLGVTADEVFTLASKGQVSAEVFQAAMEQGFGGAALKAGETVQGAMANMEASLARLGAALLGTTFEGLPEVLGQITEIFDSLAPQFKAIGDTIGPVLIDTFKQLLTALAPILQPIAELVVSLLPPLMSIIAAVAPLVTKLIQAFVPLIAAILPPLMILFDALFAVIETLITNILLPLIPIIVMLVEAFTPILNAILPPLVALFDFLAQVIGVVITAITPLIEAVLPIVISLFEAFMDPLTRIINMILPILIQYLNAVIPFWMELAAAIMPLVEELLPLLEPLLTPFLDLTAELLEAILPYLPPLIEGFSTALKWLMDNVLKPIIEVIRSVVQGFKELFAFNGKSVVVKSSVVSSGRVGSIPGRAAGGGASNTGLSWVGEKGPELITMPRGAVVTPVPQHMRADALMGSNRDSGRTAVYNINVTGGMGVDGAQLGEQIVTAIRKYERTSGAVFARA